MNIINEFFVSFILIKLYFKFKVCRKIKFPLLWKFYFSKWKFYFSADNIFGYLIFNASIDFRFKAIFMALIVSLFFAFLAAFFPIKKALKINVCENLKGE